MRFCCVALILLASYSRGAPVECLETASETQAKEISDSLESLSKKVDQIQTTLERVDRTVNPNPYYLHRR